MCTCQCGFTSSLFERLDESASVLPCFRAPLPPLEIRLLAFLFACFPSSDLSASLLTTCSPALVSSFPPVSNVTLVDLSSPRLVLFLSGLSRARCGSAAAPAEKTDTMEPPHSPLSSRSANVTSRSANVSSHFAARTRRFAPCDLFVCVGVQ